MAMSTATASRRQSSRAGGRMLIVAALIGTLVLALTAGSVSAAKGGGSKGGKQTDSTLSLVTLDSADGLAYHTHRLAFEVSTTATDRPFVGVRCWQGSAWVLDAYTGYFEDYMFDPWLTLDSPYWAAGVEANCTARLFYYNKRGDQKVLATLDFAALP